MSETATNAIIRLEEGEDLFRNLAVAVSDCKVFSSRHPRFVRSGEQFLEALGAFFARHPEERHVLFVHRQGQVYFRRMPLAASAPPAIKLGRLLQERSVEGIRFGPDSDLSALTECVEGLHSREAAQSPVPWEEVNARLERLGLKGKLGFFADSDISRFSSPGDDEDATAVARAPERSVLSLPELLVPLDLYRRSLAALHDLMALIASGRSPPFDPVLEIAGAITEGVAESDDSFLQLATLHYDGHFTFNHSVNVCLLVTAALKPFVKSRERLLEVGQAALLHDLGKAVLADDLLYKPEVPTREESAELERHVAVGAEILRDVREVRPLALVAAFDHHRRPGGTGYPPCRRERPLDAVTALIAAADIFEALVAERPYKERLSALEAFEAFLLVPESCGLERAARVLWEAVTPSPPGSLVELTSGERALVTRVRRGDPAAPCIRLVSGDGPDLKVAPEEIDLAGDPPGDPGTPRVRRILPPPAAPGGDAEPGDSEASRAERLRALRRRLEDGTLLASEG